MNHINRFVPIVLACALVALCTSCRSGAPFSQDPADSLAPASGRFYTTYQKWPTTLEQAEMGATHSELGPMSRARDAKFTPQGDGTLIIEWTNPDGSPAMLHIRSAPHGQVVILDRK